MRSGDKHFSPLRYGGHDAQVTRYCRTLFNYVPDATQTDTALTGIKLLISVIPGILYMSCALFMIFYNLDARTTDLMKKDLDARRASQAPA